MSLATTRARRFTRHLRLERGSRSPESGGLLWVVGSEATAGAVGFFVLVHQARSLGPSSFAALEYAGAVMAWMLVLVRGGMDVIVYREAARRPRLVGRLTQLLIGLRLVAASVGYLLIMAVAATAGAERAGALLVAGLSLFASAWVADVGLRASCRVKELAASQALRAFGTAGAVYLCVRGPSDLMKAALCLVVGEVLGAVVPCWRHCREHGWTMPGLRKRAALVIAKRGAVTGLTRFVRVTLYGLDLLALGWWAGSEFGPYAASRRLVFAMVAIGLVVPAVLGPRIARAWCEGVGPTRKLIGDSLAMTWAIGLPAAIGLGLTAERWMPLLFGEAYRQGGPWLALLASRLPWLLTATFAQAALIACRREDWSLRLAFGQLAAALVLLPFSIWGAGAWGVGWVLNLVEMGGAVGGWVLLSRLKIAPGISATILRPFVGCLAMCVVCGMTKSDPLPVVVVAAAAAYGLAWRVCARRSLTPSVPRGVAR